MYVTSGARVGDWLGVQLSVCVNCGHICERLVDVGSVARACGSAPAGGQVPTLCPCGLTVFSANTLGCAKNCVFYNNPKALSKAVEDIYYSLQSVVYHP
jgi:hypothetical protein